MTIPKILELDHRLGRHNGQSMDGCPTCRPDLFTADDRAADSNADRNFIDAFGLNEPRHPRVGDVWHEPGRGLWLWYRQFDESEYWVNALDISKVRSNTQMTLTLENLPNVNPSVTAHNLSTTISEELLTSKAMGVDVLTEAREQTRARLVADLMGKDLVACSSIITREDDDPLRRGVRVTASVLVRPRPSFSLSDV